MKLKAQKCFFPGRTSNASKAKVNNFLYTTPPPSHTPGAGHGVGVASDQSNTVTSVSPAKHPGSQHVATSGTGHGRQLRKTLSLASDGGASSCGVGVTPEKSYYNEAHSITGTSTLTLSNKYINLTFIT